MNRLTTTKKLDPEFFKNLKDIDENTYFLKIDGKSYEDAMGTIAFKLGQLEDIENELGIDLVTLFKALKNGFWAKSSNEITFYKEDKKHTVFIRHLGYDVEICCEESENAIGSKCLMYLERSTKNYGKTWALTREELEK